MTKETFIDKLVKSVRQNSLRRVIFFTWLISLAVGVLSGILGFGGGGAIAEMYAVEFGFFIYFIVCCFHCIPRTEVSKKVAYLGLGGLALFLSSMLVTSMDDSSFNHFLKYVGNDPNPLSSFTIALWLVLENQLGMITLLSGTGLHIYAAWRASKECAKRYRYLFHITAVAYSALILMLLLLLAGDKNIWYSYSVYCLLMVWMLSPALIFFAAIIREGNGNSLDPTVSNDLVYIEGKTPINEKKFVATLSVILVILLLIIYQTTRM